MLDEMKIQEILSHNILLIQKVTGDSNRQMSQSGVTDRTVGNMINMTSVATIESVEKLARYYRVPPWLLLVEGLSEADLKDMLVENVVNNYLKADEHGRQALAILAEREAVLSKKVSPPPFFDHSKTDSK